MNWPVHDMHKREREELEKWLAAKNPPLPKSVPTRKGKGLEFFDRDKGPDVDWISLGFILFVLFCCLFCTITEILIPTLRGDPYGAGRGPGIEREVEPGVYTKDGLNYYTDRPMYHKGNQ